MKYRFASLLILAASFTSATYAADARGPNVNELASIKVTAAPGDSISAARSHHHEYILLAHALTNTVDVIDVTKPAAPRQLSGSEATKAREEKQAADASAQKVMSDFPGAVSTTSDHRKLIYVLDQDSLRIISPVKQQPDKGDSDDGWFRNAQTPG